MVLRNYHFPSAVELLSNVRRALTMVSTLMGDCAEAMVSRWSMFPRLTGRQAPPDPGGRGSET